ncbi:hypothetical protein BsWGS_23127 [Bradybaena similaris]
MKTILFLTCLNFIGAPKVYGVSTKVLNFVDLFNGIIDNKNQTQQPGDDHALIQVRVIPVDIDCLRPNPVVFVEQASNRVIEIFVLAEVTDGIEDTVSLTYYTFANKSNYKPGEFNVESFSTMPCGELNKVENCTGSYRVTKGYVYGNFPECSYSFDGKHPQFSMVYTCDSCTATAPQNTHQVATIEPYEFQYKQPKFPVINPPEGYVSPCGP